MDPTALSIAVLELQEARIDLLKQTKLREYHGAMELMLRDRITRLKDDIHILTNDGGTE